MRHELFIGFRYLYRQRHGRVVKAATIVSALAFAAIIAAYFLTGNFLFAVIAVPLVHVALFFLLMNFFSVFTTVSIEGVILGVAALTVVLSVTSGFQLAFRQKVLGVNGDVIVMKYGRDFTEYRDVIKKAEALPHVKAAAPFLFNEMMLAHGPALSGVIIKGIDPRLSQRTLDIAQRMTVGRVDDLSTPRAPTGGGPPLPEVFLGKGLQKKLKAKIGDRVRVVSPKAQLDPESWTASGAAAPMREFRVAGVFYYGFEEYDSRLVYIDMKEAQAFFKSADEPEDKVTGVELKLDNANLALPTARALDDALGGAPYRTMDWEELNHNLFTALRMQKVALVIFLTLIILVAAFNIVAALTMLVIDKTKEIAILKSMGMRAAGVARLFQVAGLTIGAVGTVCGLGVGLLVCLVVERFGYQLDPKVYLIDKLPVQINLQELVLTAGITIAICFLATLYPALKAATLDPVEGLRYE